MPQEFRIVIKSPPVGKKGDWQEVHEFDQEVRLLDFELHPDGRVIGDFWVDLAVGPVDNEQILTSSEIHLGQFVGKGAWGPNTKGLPTRRLAVRAEAQEPNKDLHLIVRVTLDQA